MSLGAGWLGPIVLLPARGELRCAWAGGGAIRSLYDMFWLILLAARGALVRALCCVPTGPAFLINQSLFRCILLQ